MDVFGLYRALMSRGGMPKLRPPGCVASHTYHPHPYLCGVRGEGGGARRAGAHMHVGNL